MATKLYYRHTNLTTMKTYFFIMMLMLPLLATAQRTSDLVTAGKAMTEVTPDISIININVSATHLNYGKAMDLLQQKADETKRFLNKKGIAKSYITSENFAINKEYAYENRKQVNKGYKATLSIKLEFKNDLKQVNKVLNALGESSPEAEVNIWHKVSQELQDKVNDQLIEAAIKDAKHKAELIAKNTNQVIYRIQKINYGVEEKQSVAPHIESKYMAMDRSLAEVNNNLSIQPEPRQSSTEIIIYWSLMQNE